MSNIPLSWIPQQNSAIKSSLIPTRMTSEPQLLKSGGNIINFKFSPLELNPTSFKAKTILDVYTSIGAGEKLTFITNLFEISITSSLTPSYGEFIVFTGTPTVLVRSNIAESIAYELSNNQVFSNYYNVHSEGTQVIIEAINYGSIYTLTTPFVPTGLSVIYNGIGTDRFAPEQYIDYSLFIEVYVAEGSIGDTVLRNEGVLVDTLYIPFHNELEQNVNINGLVKDYIDVVLPQKRNNVGLTIAQLDYVLGKLPISRPYFIVYGDSFRYVKNGERKQRVQGMSSIRYVQNSALDLLLPYDLQQYVLNPSTSFPFKFYTNCPNDKEVTYDSHEYLSWYQLSTNLTGEFGYEVVTRFYDNTTFTQIGNSQPYSTTKGIVSLDVSPTTINIQGIEAGTNKLVDSYTVRVWWTNGVTTTKYYSELRTFKIHRKCVESSNNLIFLNEFGVWDSLEFRGYLSEGVRRELNIINRAIPFDANEGNITNEVSLTHNLSVDKTISISSGYMSNSHYSWVKQILSSPAVFIWNQKYLQYQHIIIDDYTYDYNTKDSEFNLNITFKYTTKTNIIER